MPIISAFFGMIVRVFHADHAPPHVHVRYGDCEAIFEIKTGQLLHGKLPPRLEKVMREWLKLRRREVMKSWGDAQEHTAPRRVRPIE